MFLTLGQSFFARHIKANWVKPVPHDVTAHFFFNTDFFFDSQSRFSERLFEDLPNQSQFFVPFFRTESQ